MTNHPKPRPAPFHTALVVGGGITPERVAAFLPSNYRVLDHDCVGREGDSVVIGGRDSAGWTLATYVTPRLATGQMYVCEDEPELTSWNDQDDYDESMASDAFSEMTGNPVQALGDFISAYSSDQ